MAKLSFKKIFGFFKKSSPAPSLFDSLATMYGFDEDERGLTFFTTFLIAAAVAIIIGSAIYLHALTNSQ